MNLPVRSCFSPPPGVAAVKKMTLASQEGVDSVGVEIEVFAAIGHLAHAGTEFCRGDVMEGFEKAREVVDTNNILLKAVVAVSDPGDCIADGDITVDEEEKDDGENIGWKSHDSTCVLGE